MNKLSYLAIALPLFLASSAFSAEQSCRAIVEKLVSPEGALANADGVFVPDRGAGGTTFSRLLIKDFQGNDKGSITFDRPAASLYHIELPGAVLYTDTSSKVWVKSLENGREVELPVNPAGGMSWGSSGTGLININIGGTNGAPGSTYVVNGRAGTVTPVNNIDTNTSTSFSGNHFTTLADQGKTLVIVDSVTGERETIALSRAYRWASFYVTRQIELSGDNSASASAVKTATGWKIIERGNDRIAGVLENGDYLMNIGGTTYKLIDGRNGQTRQEWPVGPNNNINFSADGRHFLVFDSTKTDVFKSSDLASVLGGNSRPAPLFSFAGQGSTLTFSKGDKAVWYYVYGQNSLVSKFRNMKTGKELSVENGYSPMVSDDGTVALVNKYVANQSSIVIVDLNQGRVRNVSSGNSWGSSIGRDGTAVFNVSAQNTSSKYVYHSSCTPTPVEILTANSGASPTKVAAVKNLCAKPDFSSSDWDRVLPDISSGKLSSADARLYLTRFQRKGGFDPKRHLPLLNSILASTSAKEEPGLVAGALQMIGMEHPLVFDKLLRAFPSQEIWDKLTPSTSTSDCRTSQEKAAIVQHASAHAAKLADPKQPRPRVEDWAELGPYRNELKNLPKQQREALVDHVATQLATAASQENALNAVFYSKLYYFAKQKAEALLGGESKKMTDATLVREKQDVVPIIIGSDPIDGNSDTETDYGFSAKRFPPVSAPAGAATGQKFESVLKWIHAGKSYTAEVDLTVTASLDDFVPVTKTFDYAALKADKVFAGLLLIGSNLSSLAHGVIDEHMAYYRSQGFKIDSQVELADIPKFLEEKVAGGEIDFLMKDAHSDGDEKNLLRVTKKGYLIVGRKKHANGLEERIYLVSPGEDTSTEGTTLLSNRDFGSWIQKRDKDKRGPLVYFNGSCSSYSKAQNEIAASRSRSLVLIPTVVSATGFANTPYHTAYQMIHAFRQEKTFEQIREAMKLSRGYPEKDHYVFPDEEKYQEYIRQHLKAPVDTEVVVRDENGKVINIDESNDHH